MFRGDNELNFFLIKLLIFPIIVIVVFYKNIVIIATLDGLKSLILLLILPNIRLDL